MELNDRCSVDLPMAHPLTGGGFPLDAGCNPLSGRFL